MKIHEKFMKKCLELAKLGLGETKSNPLVGCVIVYKGKIISQGYHERYGGNHAEINAIQKVKDKNILSECTLYVNLEPCFHYGKTPPCVNTVIQHQIKHIVIGTIDPFKDVSGESVKELKTQTKVTLNVLKDECIKINMRYFTNILFKRPYIILKWAESSDGFINNKTTGITKISSRESTILNHKWRSQVDGIMVGTNTVICDNPILTTRKIIGTNPVRITIDTKNRLQNQKLNILNSDSETIIFYNGKSKKNNNINYINIKVLHNKHNNKEILKHLMKILKDKDLNTVLVEGGRELIQNFIDTHLWDEIRVFHNTKMKLQQGIKSPKVIINNSNQEEIGHDILKIMINKKSIKKIEQAF